MKYSFIDFFKCACCYLVVNSYLTNLHQKGNLARRFPFFMASNNVNNYENLMSFD